MLKINNCNYAFGGYRIYGNGQVYYSTNRSYLEAEELQEDGETLKKYNTKRIISIGLNGEIKKANKLNLNRKDNFKIIESLEFAHPSRQEVLYIHISEIEVEKIGDVISLKMEYETNYIDAYKVNFKNGYTVETRTSREVDENYIFQNEQEKRSYWKNENTGKRYVMDTSIETLNDAILTGDYYTRTEKSDFRLKTEEIAEEFEKILNNRSISSYDIERLLKVFKIEKLIK